ncbi:flagellar hook-basal body protein [Holophaga foetida]|uniref:flagellar hook-basal body protein n=1 Tax=Holophaga foetida TaxID=35839 RepID=UPI0002474645|nr:flagellar hook basal-body protein [Holophaga foetida]
MENVLAVTLNSMHQDMSRLDRVAFNLANAATPGFKREVAVSRPFLSALEDAATSVRGMEGQHPTLQVRLDLGAGTLKSTGESLDLALTGDGFFEVSTEAGLAYTRQGSFHLDAQGRLVTAQGHAVMGTRGEIFLKSPNPSIDATGQIRETPKEGESASPEPVAQIKVVRFEATQAMQRLGDGLMTAGTNLGSANLSGQVRQGNLENANVSSLQEMVQMMQTMRHFESMQKVAQGYDELLGTAIHKLGDLS